MAKKAPKENGSINKSQAIKSALEKDPHASPTQLSADLTARGINVSPAYVSTIKHGLKTKAKKGRKRQHFAAAQSRGGSALDASGLIAAKKLVDRVGSVEQVEALLGTLKKLL